MSSIIDTVTGSSGRKAGRAAEKAGAVFDDINTPSIDSMRLELEDMVRQGVLTPEQAQAELLSGTAYENIAGDPTLKDAQLGALTELQDIVANDGLGARSKARLNEITTEGNALEKGQRDALLQQANQRGVGGSGIEYATLLANQQGSAGRKAQQDMDVAALAEQQALEAIMNQGSLSTEMRGQDFNEQERVAAAKDEIARFNAANKQQTNYMNTEANNNAQQFNLQEKQRIADGNTQNANVQQQYNKELNQRNFDNQMQKAGGQAGALTNQAGIYQDRQNASDTFTGGLIEGGAKVIAASDVNLKTDIEEVDPSKFLDELTGYKYKYKSPQEHGEGEQVGIMAQDLEKVAPQAIEEHPDGKHVDFEKMGGPILAALAGINDRLKKIEG